MIAANTQLMGLACKNMANVLRRPQRCLIYCKDGFARGGQNCICKCVRADTIALYSSVRADTNAYAKPSGGHYCICNNVIRIVLHRGHNCMRHRRSLREGKIIWLIGSRSTPRIQICVFSTDSSSLHDGVVMTSMHRFIPK